MRLIERPFSDLLRNPKDVTHDVETSDVLLRRRDQPALRLTRADREDARAMAFAAIGRALRNLAVHERRALTAALVDAFPWLDFIPVKEQQVFVEEFSRVVAAASELDNFASLGQLVHEWRATAEIYADPTLARRLKRQLDAEGDQVQRPSVP